ncbi:MAG TPA: septal ring lytic transglycosylase RlpA family protein, partial [Chromatiaceae bacterium]|nr:septal ring lytic transglycosylase RlpA family protein [Chromatiaceae bacterium]
YGVKFHGRRTSSGETYDMYAMTAAHKTLPLPTWVRVTNQRNGKSVVVKVNDRGPFHPGRIIDLSYAAAAKLGILARGTAPVEIEVVTTEKTARHRARPSSSRRYIQAGAFSSLTNARSLQRRLDRAQKHPVQIHHDGTLHRVVVGPLVKPADRRNLERLLHAWGIQPHALVQ